ncbi:unnamed protein product [Rotaria magnacalcarata]|uniref:Integrase catalytic domain-containing protein n=1 Tax=Rotaria magnacalcarata TaxID=392030 RepID=A0A819N0K8_9BILA|nr:unnamed protein product [Rotaria magnacalcarata]CAF4075593.1 unnamed protein product [Rotaria magnacalcarata]
MFYRLLYEIRHDYTLPTCSAQVTAEAIFKEHICCFGVPKAIISDQGTSFKKQLMFSFAQLLGYHHIFCTPYQPSIKWAKHNNWDEYLYLIVFAYNTGVHSTTNFTPFELTLGRAANLPTDRPPTTFTFSHPQDYLDQLVRNLKYYRTTVRQNIKQQHAQSKARYDRRCTNPQYDLGTMVLTRIFTSRSKLDPRFSLDPKIIVNRQHPIYWVKALNSTTISRIHVNDIRPLSTRSNVPSH